MNKLFRDMGIKIGQVIVYNHDDLQYIGRIVDHSDMIIDIESIFRSDSHQWCYIHQVTHIVKNDVLIRVR